MSISHTYRGFEVIRHAENQHEVPTLGMTLPSEHSAHQAIDADIADWMAGYSEAVGTPSAPVDTARPVSYADADTVRNTQEE